FCKLRGLPLSPLYPYTTLFRSWYSAEERRRFEVRPGITGLAQVAGRNLVEWNARLAYDIEYVDRWSLWLDLKILLQTVSVVFSQDRKSTRLNSSHVKISYAVFC